MDASRQIHRYDVTNYPKDGFRGEPVLKAEESGRLSCRRLLLNFHFCSIKSLGDEVDLQAGAGNRDEYR